MSDTRTRKSVLFAGAYGIQNAGDDLPLILMCEHLTTLYPDVEFDFRALSRHPDPWEEQAYGVTMVKNLEFESGDQAKGKWFQGLNFGDDTSALGAVKQEIRNSDLLVFGAGNFLIDITIDTFRGPIPLLAVYVFLARLYHKPVVLYGISAGPIATAWGRELTGWILENVDLVTVRDHQSKQVLQELNHLDRDIHVLPDSTLAQKKVEAGGGALLPPRARTYRLALGLRDVTRVTGAESAERFNRVLIAVLDGFKDDFEFVFVPQSTYREDDDREYAARLAGLLGPDAVCRVLDRRYHPRDLIAVYGECDLTVAIRLHAAVFSAIAHTPVIALNYLPKVRGFMDTIGLADYLRELEGLQAAELSGLIERVLAERDHLVGEIRVKKARLEQAAAGYAQLIREHDLLKLGNRESGS